MGQVLPYSMKVSHSLCEAWLTRDVDGERRPSSAWLWAWSIHSWGFLGAWMRDRPQRRVFWGLASLLMNLGRAQRGRRQCRQGLRGGTASGGGWELIRSTRSFWLVGFNIPQVDLFQEMTKFRSHGNRLLKSSGMQSDRLTIDQDTKTWSFRQSWAFQKHGKGFPIVLWVHSC